MIRVYVREDLVSDGVLLGEFWPSDLPELVRRFQDYGTYMAASEDCHFCVYYSSQFKVSIKDVIFEIIVEKER